MNYTTLRKRTYVIPGETPSQKNNQTFNTKTRTIFKSEQFRKWFDRAYPEIIRQGVPDKPYQYARIVILFRHDSLRVRDGDNQLSAIQDLLKRANVIEDDCWTRIGTPVVEHDVSAFAECVIKVTEITPINWNKKLREEKSKNLLASRGGVSTGATTATTCATGPSSDGDGRKHARRRENDQLFHRTRKRNPVHG